MTAIGLAAAAAMVLVPAASASASTYQDLYSFNCGAGKWKIVSDTTGNVQHYRNGSLSAYWYGSAVRAVHSDAPLTPHSGSSSSVETAGANKWVYAASASCV